jgi:ElaB/YqjD/DUF883 family membrane-anchored ribosome-binding protein
MANQTSEATQQKRTNGRDFTSSTDDESDVGDSGNGLEKAKDTAETLLGHARTAAVDAYDTVTEKASSTIDERKVGLADGLSSVADSIRQAGEGLSKNKGQHPVTGYSAQYAKTAADKIETVAEYIETKDLKDMARDVEGFARRNPAIFLAGAFVLGMAAARVFKSTPAAVGSASAGSD